MVPVVVVDVVDVVVVFVVVVVVVVAVVVVAVVFRVLSDFEKNIIDQTVSVSVCLSVALKRFLGNC